MSLNGYYLVSYFKILGWFKKKENAFIADAISVIAAASNYFHICQPDFQEPASTPFPLICPQDAGYVWFPMWWSLNHWAVSKWIKIHQLPYLLVSNTEACVCGSILCIPLCSQPLSLPFLPCILVPHLLWHLP